MVNEDILTSLKNAIEHGESLDSAVNSMINSGYNAKEVREAAGVMSYGATTSLQQKPEEQLIMPSKKSFFGKMINKSAQPSQSTAQYQQPKQIQQSSQQFQTIQNQQTSIQQNPNAIKENIGSGTIIPQTQTQKQSAQPAAQPRSQPQTQQYKQPQQFQQPYQQIEYRQVPLNPEELTQSDNPKKQSYVIEIILLIILLILLGFLISTIVFRESILNFIQSFQAG